MLLVEVFWTLFVHRSALPWGWAFFYPICSGIGLWSAVCVVQFLTRDRLDFGQTRHVSPFLLFNGLLGPVLSGSIGAFGLLWLRPGYSWLSEAEKWALGDALSVLLVTPLLLSWLRPAPAAGEKRRGLASRAEELLLYTVLVALAYLILRRGDTPVRSVFHVPHVTVPVVLWAALRFRIRTVTTALAISAGFLIFQARREQGLFFEAAAGNPASAMLSMQLYLAVVSTSSLLVSSFVLHTRRTGALLQRRLDELTETRGALHESESRLDQLVANIDTVFWMLDPRESKFLYVSPAFERFWGGSIEELQADAGAWLQCVHPHDRQRIAASWDGGRKQNRTEPWAQEFRIVRPGGQVIYIRDRVYPLLDDNGEAYRYLGHCVDVTQDVMTKRRRNELEGQLHEAQKMESVGQLAAGVAHDVNNVLTVIQGHAELIAQEAEALPDAVRPSLPALDEAIGQAAGITRSLLTFSRRSETRREAIDLRAVVERSAKLIERTLPARIELSTHYAVDEGPWVSADETQIQQVLLNLAINARDAMPEGGSLSIELGEALHDGLDVPPEEATDSLHSHTVSLLVRDTGTGISPEVQRRIFEPFFTTKERDRGTGLGLAVVRGIVREHGGRIEVASAVGDGTTFTVKLPCSPEAPVATAGDRDSSALPRGAGQPVLLVEDDAGVRFVLAMQLQRLGYEVVEAHNGEEMMAAVQAAPGFHQLIVTDVDLPRLSGPDALRQLRAGGDRTSALIVTGTDDARVQDLVSDSVDVATEILTKPFPFAQLAEIVDRLVRA